MRALPATFAASAGVHAVIWLAWRLVSPEAPPPPPPEPVTVVEIVAAAETAEPIEVVMVPAAVVPPAGASGVRHQASGPEGRSLKPGASFAIATGRAMAASEAGLGRAPERGAEPPKKGAALAIPPGTIESLLRNTKPLPPPIVPSGVLVQNGRQHEVRDGVTTMRVEGDGNADFADKPDFEAHFALPLPSIEDLKHPEKAMKDLGNGVAAMVDEWYKDPYAQTKAPAVGELPPHERAIEGGWDSGSRSGGGGGGGGGATVPIFGGSFDITAWATRKAGGDPYAARKQKLLDATRAERMEIGAKHRAAQLERAPEMMRRHLRRLWREVTDPAKRRALLFELWDECEEGDGPTGEAGQAARTQVIGWIRGHLPAGSAGAYTESEIRRLDARRKSKQPFAPY